MKPCFRVFLPAILSVLFWAVPVTAAPCWEELGIKPLDILRWNAEEKLCGYRNMEHLWTANTVSRGDAPVSSLPKAATTLPDPGPFMKKNGVYGLLVLHNGAVLLEHYRGEFGPESRWTSFSMAKSLTSLLVGAAVADGSIKSLDDPVADYLPELAKGAYAPATLRQILTMTSGASWNEDYRDPKSDVAKLADLADTTEESFLAYMAGLSRTAKPGTRFNYSTGESGVIGHLVRRATGKNLAAYMSEKIWAKAGMEKDAIWITNRSGAEINGCCFSATLRDYGRIGLFMLRGGRIGETRVLPEWWMREAATASKPATDQGRPYGYQLWVRDNGSYQASGIFGQLIHVDPARSLVVVMLSAWPTATGNAELHTQRQAFLARIKEQFPSKKKKS